MCLQNHGTSGTKEIATSAPKNLEEICLQQNYDTHFIINSACIFQDTCCSYTTILIRHNISSAQYLVFFLGGNTVQDACILKPYIYTTVKQD